LTGDRSAHLGFGSGLGSEFRLVQDDAGERIAFLEPGL
jgi:hypothetical protein